MHPRTIASAATAALALTTLLNAGVASAAPSSHAAGRGPSATSAAASASAPRLSLAGQAMCRSGYTAEQVGDAGGRTSRPTALTDSGIVGGTASTGPDFRPQLPYTSRHGVDALLAVPAGSTFGRVLGMNNAGVAVGEVFAASPERSQPAVWDRSGRLRLLGDSGVANDVNARGDVVGSQRNAAGETAATRWSKKGTVHLPHLSASEGTFTATSVAFAVDARGTVVGHSRVLHEEEGHDGDHGGHRHAHAHRHAALWDKAGRAHDLGALFDHGTSDAAAVHGSHVVGEASTEDGRATAVSFTAAGPQALADTGWRFSDAHGVNARGEVVGHGAKFRGNTSFGGAATVWCEGVAVDLNTVVGGLPAGWTLLDATAVNARGQITASGKDADGRGVSVLLTPRD
ncbi:hypothetical protein [Micrococcus sp.]|uniref:hypothetical protein n=1 Tax=Micrococcus sp. TaxID=1271 RepID=UPI002A90FECB|nr:hypothetical protein [Micrococcus sp.]MDY6055041.1 hypothetical protein [Micrococcus sp.]